jgi:hypothetical protein
LLLDFKNGMLETLITSKTRLRILVKFFINMGNTGYLRGLAEEMNESTNAIRKELNNLTDAGYLEKEADQHRVSYKANHKHPLYATLQKLVRHHVGIDTIVSQVLERMGAVEKIRVIGDYAKGKDSGRIEVVLEGENLNVDYIDQLSEKLEKEIKRKVHFIVTTFYEGDGILLYNNKKNSADGIAVAPVVINKAV